LTAYADIYPITVTRPGQPARQMRDVMTVSVTASSEKTAVFPMVRKRKATGFTRGPKKYTWEAEVAVPLAGLEIGWFEMLDLDEECLMEIEHGDGGERRQLVDFVVDEITDSSNGEGNATTRIRGKATDYRKDLANPVAEI
jgi:hypothetical protein